MPAPYKINPTDVGKLQARGGPVSNAALPEKVKKHRLNRDDAEKNFAVSWVMFPRYKTHLPRQVNPPKI
jgi:hypothetical protein